MQNEIINHSYVFYIHKIMVVSTFCILEINVNLQSNYWLGYWYKYTIVHYVYVDENNDCDIDIDVYG